MRQRRAKVSFCFKKHVNATRGILMTKVRKLTAAAAHWRYERDSIRKVQAKSQK